MALAASTALAAGAGLPLVHGDRPAGEILVVRPPGDGWLIDHAARTLTGTVQAWSGVMLPVVTLAPSSDHLPPGSGILLATTEGLQGLAGAIPEVGRAIAQAGSLDEQGFICGPFGEGASARMLVTSRSPRGVFNGATWLRDFAIDGTKQELTLELRGETRSPRLNGRAIYLLTIWGTEARYTADDWIGVFDGFARDGVDRVYFWLSGHFPSRRYPQAYRCVDGKWDSTAASGIPRTEDHHRIIRAAHERGLKIYLGGALGGWVGTRFLTGEAPGTMKIPPKGAPEEARLSLCPSSPASRHALREYYREMFDASPEADGLFIESADEWGGCACERCGRVVDDHGSTYFGQAQLTLVQEIMAGIWRSHPHARLCYTIGYGEHRADPAYYRLVRQMNDSRIEWMEARDSWVLPGPDGEPRPVRWFSRQVLRWRQFYNLPADDLVRDANRAAEDGLYGLICAFEPGFATGDIYRQIPYPTDRFPYLLTGFVWREMTWEPSLNREAVLRRVQQRFFGNAAPAGAAEDLWTLRDIMRAAASGKLKPALRTQLKAIDERVEAARPGATPKCTEGLEMMRKAIEDIRNAVP